MRPRFFYDLPSVFAGHIQQAEAEADRVFEPIIAVVVDNKDPDKLGRVKVKYPTLAEKDSSWWAPIIMLGAGKNRGWFFIPEVDDEVLVLFEHGDIERPMVVGALWNGKDKPPDNNASGSNPRRMIKSRAGSTFTFDDEKKSITIADGGGVGKIVFEAESNKITIEAMQGDVAFQSPQGAMTIACKTATFEASTAVEIVAGQKLEWGSGADATLKASTLTISGSKANANGGDSAAPGQPSVTPAEVPDPVGTA